ncbi:LRR receptor-like serine/threonine-protein kinase ERL1 [Hibiscus syriacus]|uniref:LRR receptor-like serine/threonine-protein kinase ERL1 n=1 Tax=Hibiscus syriacus TaxID=106335 RepID=A0A6A2ZCN3_HIBSY|nr:LRR receptor-like serine/threonine-protein kinase ERL1 [Hibiscus syriacus]
MWTMYYDWTDATSSDFVFGEGSPATMSPSMSLHYLNLDGEISPAIGDLKDLITLGLQDGLNIACVIRDLSFNELYGDIPFSISKLKQLELLILKNNQLVGPIPSTLSQIPNLKVLDLAQNRLSGEIPRLIYWNEVLQYLGLRGNNLVGTLSLDICQLTGLWYFDVRNNSLTGSIPQNIGNCTAFQLTGEIPFNIGFLQVATLSLQGNRLLGKIPSVIGLMQALAVLDLSSNKLTGPIPSILGNLTYTEKLYLHNNQLAGSIPPKLGNMSKLHYLELNDNLLTGHIPSELGKLTELYDLNVANNKLEGPIPSNLSSCTNLNSLNVHGNKLNGTIPPAFERLESMTYLNLSSNNIKGSIPIELSRIGNLDTLDLSDNEISGSIPSLGDLEHLLKNLSRNRLTGVIPEEFANLRSVMEIDLSYDNLSGVIPEELMQLQNMFLLRLENNSLSGDVMSLSGCMSLTILNVSDNNLVGVIPTNNNFSRFSPDRFDFPIRILSLFLSEIPGFVAIGSLLHAMNEYSFCSSLDAVVISKAAILGIALGALVILLMILFAACHPQNPPPFPDGSLDKPVTYSRPKLVILHMNMALHVYEDIMRMTENLSEKYIIGNGASSTVYKCVLKNCKPVAIKRLYSHCPRCLKEFETELETVGSIKHRNLVCLQGYSLSPSGNLLFYDYMENGSLWDLLHADNAVMETVDPEITESCKDLGAAKKVFQLALLCTKKHPSDRPTMHEVTQDQNIPGMSSNEENIMGKCV